MLPSEVHCIGSRMMGERLAERRGSPRLNDRVKVGAVGCEDVSAGETLDSKATNRTRTLFTVKTSCS
jgi:hypothetical protein